MLSHSLVDRWDVRQDWPRRRPHGLLREPSAGWCVVLGPLAASVGLARRFVRTRCVAMSDEAIEVITLLTSELVTNAVLHARTRISVSVVPQRGGVRVSVTDGAVTRPLVLPPSCDGEGGRGMQMVEALASSWGVEDRHPGKSVWFAVHG